MSRLFSWTLNVLYALLLLVFSPFILYRMIVQGKYRAGFAQKLLGQVPELPLLEKNKKRIWFHAVSVGEVNVLRPLLKRIREQKPDWECVISTTSLTGMELAKKLYGSEQTVFYCPLDFSWAVKKAVRRIKPTLLVLTEQEIWPNLFFAAKQSGCKLALINGRFGESGYLRYKRFRCIFRPLLKMLNVVAVQSETYAGWFHCIGASGDAIEVTGSMKFDGAQTDTQNPKTVALKKLAGISEQDIVFLAGSTQDPEEEMALRVYETLKPQFPALKLVLVPRHPERFATVAQMLTDHHADWKRRSEWTTQEQQANKEGPSIILVDTIGELGAWWGTAQIAFVGGSMGSRGGQNMIEPAAYGAAVSFGPNTKNFRDIVELLLRNDAAIVVHNEEEMLAFVRRMLEDRTFAQELGERAATLVRSQLGATDKTLALLARCIETA
ncbi:MAG: 3-deoxy-D-manno-octulosonic acid transferase [Thermoguttaceae bacterium]